MEGEQFKELILELTSSCPSQCVHCSSYSSPTCSDELGLDVILRLVEEAVLLGAQKLSLGGGEPTSSETFFPTLMCAADVGMYAEVFTCGLGTCGSEITGLPARTEEFCSELPNTKFIFSFHGASGQVHDSITRIHGSFQTMLHSIKRLLSTGIECEMNFVPLRPNVCEFPQLVLLAGELGIKRISVLRFVPQGRGSENRDQLELPTKEEARFVDTLLALRQNSAVEIRTGSPFNGIIPSNAVPCRAGTEKLVVQANGNVLPCEVFKHHDRCNWNLFVPAMTISEIVQCPTVRALRRSLERSDCLECPVHKHLGIGRLRRSSDEHIPGVAVHT